MVGVAIVAVLVYAVLTAADGVRLLWLAHRTRELPALWAGTGYVFGGVLGWALVVLGVAFKSDAPLLSRWFGYAGLLFFSGGILCFALFAWRVFAPRSR